MPVYRSTGVNYGLGPPARADENGTLSEVQLQSTLDAQAAISTLHLDFNVSGIFRGIQIDLRSTIEACGSACRTKGGAFMLHSSGNTPVEILRFAKQGNVDLESALPGLLGRLRRFATWTRLIRREQLAWLATMEDGKSLSGIIDAQNGNILRLLGRMVITVQIGDAAPIELRSRQEPMLEGLITAWPPRGTVLRLSNPPIEYFNASEIHDVDASPVLSVHSNEVTLGEHEVALLIGRPRFTRVREVQTTRSATGEAHRVIRLEWVTDAIEIPPNEPQPKFYIIHRRLIGDEINGWISIATVSIDTTTYTDEDVPVGNEAEYAVTRAAQYNFNYRYESLVGGSVIV
ncbi:hypothetical protein ACU8OT_29345 (plasmid) [Rhizobium leguminosarum]